MAQATNYEPAKIWPAFLSVGTLLMAGLVVTSALMGTTPAWAQDDDTAAAVLTCDRINDPSERLACFNDLAVRLRQGGARSAGPLPPRQAVPAANAPSSQPVRAADTSGSASASVNPASLPTDDFGAESMGGKTEKAKIKQKERLQAGIVKFWRHQDGHFSVELDNGQVWRETTGTRIQVVENASSVEIYRGLFGGYRMKVEGTSKPARVKRTR